MTAQEIIDYLRVHVLRDSAKPYLWDDDLLLLRLNNAYMKFLRDTGTVLDNENFVVDLTLGQVTYDVDPRILLVQGVSIVGEQGELKDYTRRNLPAPDVTATGLPTAYAFDERTHSIRFYPAPDTTYTAVLHSLADLPEMDFSDEPLINKRYHLGLGDWVAHLCFGDNDADGLANPASDKHEKKFGVLVSEAKRDVYRFRMGNNPTANQNWTGKRG